MRRQQTGEPVWDLTYDEKGSLTSPGHDDFLREVQAEGVVDLFVMSHGWGTSEQSAKALYDVFFPLIASHAAEVPAVGPIGFAGIYWPSLWFPESSDAQGPAPTGSTQAGATGVVDVSAGTASLTGQQIAASLAPGFTDQVQQEAMSEIGRLIDDSATVGSAESEDAKTQRIRHIHALVQSLSPAPPTSGTFEDAGETALLRSDDPTKAYQAAAQAFGSAPPASSTQGVGDWFKNAINGAKDVVRVLSYTIMKGRAGDIGQNGLGPLLAELHRTAPAVRAHLIGHSFGARLVSFALSGVGSPDESPVGSLLVVQGAFSHWAFAHAQDNPFDKAGALNAFGDRVHGPLVSTFTQFDWAVGVWYPRASFLAQQDISADVAGRWDGMGRDGFQAVSPAEDKTMPAGGGTDYGLAAGSFYRVDARNVINDTTKQPFSGAHSDICKAPVAQLALAAAAAATRS